EALARVDPFPSIAGPIAGVAPPDPRLLRAAGVRAAAPSVVRVVGTACGLSVEGSGWVARPELVVTAAHVVAGEHDTAVQLFGTGSALRAIPVAVDARNDVAVLRVPGLTARPLRLVDPQPGAAVALLGYPGDGPFDAKPGRIGRRVGSRPAASRPPSDVQRGLRFVPAANRVPLRRERPPWRPGRRRAGRRREDPGRPTTVAPCSRPTTPG